MKNFVHIFKNADKVLLVLPLLFAAMSLLMIMSTSYDGEIELSRDVIVQACAYGLGYIAMFVIFQLDYNFYQHFEKILYAVSICFLLTVYIPGLGLSQYGSRAWIDLKFITIQPSEFVKLFYVILLAMYLARHRDELKEFKGIALALLYAAPFLLIVIKEDLGSGIVMVAIWIVMIFFAGISYKWFGIGAASAAAAIPVIYHFLDQYQKERIIAFLYPEDLSLKGNWQVWQSKIAIGSGGFFGKGLFKGTQKSLKYLPVQKSDFIFAVIIEELGAIGGLILLGLYSIFIYRIARIARDAVDLYGALICVGFIGMFGFQIFENIAMTMGMMPVTGITLPLISYGGSSVLASMMSLGIIMNVGMRNKALNF